MKLKKLKKSEQHRFLPAATSATDLSSEQSGQSPRKLLVDLSAKFAPSWKALKVNQGHHKRETKKKLYQIFRASFGAGINISNLRKRHGEGLVDDEVGYDSHPSLQHQPLAKYKSQALLQVYLDADTT